MRAWTRTWFAAGEIARTWFAPAKCQPPSEHEQLHIVVTLRDGRLHSECMFVGTRGTYARRTVRVSAP
jgi:hypothetical protein